MQVMETFHAIRFILPSTHTAETVPMIKTGGPAAMCSSGGAGFKRPDRIGAAVRVIPPITFQSSSSVAPYEVALFPVPLYFPDTTLIADDDLSGELMNAQLRALPAHGLAVQAGRVRRPLSGPDEH
jgi:hypothetical protein